MHKTDFIISYDISSEKRLAKISRYTEKNALRIQRSVYLCSDITKDKMCEILQNLVNMIDPKEDDLRVYNIKKGSINLKSAVDIDNAMVIS